MMVQDPFYIDFSKQPDNEIWYITFDNNPIKISIIIRKILFLQGDGGSNQIYSLLNIYMKMVQVKSFIINLLLNQVKIHLKQIM